MLAVSRLLESAAFSAFETEILGGNENLNCPFCKQKMARYNERSALYCVHSECSHYHQYYHSALCPTCSKRVWLMSENSEKPETIYCKEHAAKVAETIRKRKALEERVAIETVLKDRVKDLFDFERRIANAEKL